MSPLLLKQKEYVGHWLRKGQKLFFNERIELFLCLPAAAFSFVDTSTNETPGTYWRCPKASLPTEKMGFPPADVLAGILSHPMLVFGCAAHVEMGDSEQPEAVLGLHLGLPLAGSYRLVQWETVLQPGNGTASLGAHSQQQVDSKKSTLWRRFGSIWYHRVIKVGKGH